MEENVKSQIVELTVVGIRNYCPGGEEGLPALFERLPMGSTLFLKVNPLGTEFPGAVAVYDGLGGKIGHISKTDKRFIRAAIPKDGMLSCKVVGHSMEDLCLYVEAENNVGYEEPYIRQTAEESGELIFATNQLDQQVHTMSQLLLTQLKSDNHDLKQILSLAEDYSLICCSSLDGELSFARADILYCLRKLNKETGMFNNVIHKIHEDTKALGSIIQDEKTRVYKDQYNRIFEEAFSKKDGKSSQLETYVKTLAYGNGGNLTKDLVKTEVQKLSQLLSTEFEGTFVKASETDEDFAKALYSLNYSLRAIYIMYTRRIKREYLLDLLNNPITIDMDEEQKPVQPIKTKNSRGARKKYLFINKGNDTKEDEAVKLREKERLCKYLNQHCLKSRKLVCTKEDTLNKTIVCFLLKWMERELTAKVPSGGAVFRFLTEDCGIVNEVQEKAYANRVKEWIKDKNGYDTEVMLMVKEAFE